MFEFVKNRGHDFYLAVLYLMLVSLILALGLAYYVGYNHLNNRNEVQW